MDPHTASSACTNVVPLEDEDLREQQEREGDILQEASNQKVNKTTVQKQPIGRSLLKVIVEDKVRGMNLSGEELDQFEVTTSDIAPWAFVQKVNGIPYALKKKCGRFVIAEEDIGHAMLQLIQHGVGDWYDPLKIQKAKLSKIKFFSKWAAKKYSPSWEIIIAHLEEAGVTNETVKEFIAEHHGGLTTVDDLRQALTTVECEFAEERRLFKKKSGELEDAHAKIDRLEQQLLDVQTESSTLQERANNLAAELVSAHDELKCLQSELELTQKDAAKNAMNWKDDVGKLEGELTRAHDQLFCAQTEAAENASNWGKCMSKLSKLKYKSSKTIERLEGTTSFFQEIAHLNSNATRDELDSSNSSSHHGRSSEDDNDDDAVPYELVEAHKSGNGTDDNSH